MHLQRREPRCHCHPRSLKPHLQDLRLHFSRKTHANAGSRSPIRHWCMQRNTLSKCPAGVCCTSCIIARASHTAQTHEIGDKRSHSHLVLMMTCYQFHPVRRMKPNAAIHFHKSRITYDISCPFMCVNRREDGPLPEDTGWPNTPANAKQIRTRAWPAQRQRAATAAGPVQASPFRAVQPRAPRPYSRWSRLPRPCAGHLQP